jgi:hypothetical protein
MMVTERIKRLEGGRVSVALRGGNRLDDCHLVSAPRGCKSEVWLFHAGHDVFVEAGDIVDLWEAG